MKRREILKWSAPVLGTAALPVHAQTSDTGRETCFSQIGGGGGQLFEYTASELNSSGDFENMRKGVLLNTNGVIPLNYEIRIVDVVAHPNVEFYANVPLTGIIQPGQEFEILGAVRLVGGSIDTSACNSGEIIAQASFEARSYFEDTEFNGCLYTGQEFTIGDNFINIVCG